MGLEVSGVADEEFETILRDRAITPVFQPIVALDDENVIGYEGLARGPDGKYHTPAALFEAAAKAGRGPELGWLCTVLAGQRFLASGLRDVALFVNLDPATMTTPCPPDLADAYDQMMQEAVVVIEITERAVSSDPAGLMAAVLHARSRSARVALDDVGVEPASLSAMPLINPDIIKIDRSIVQGHSTSWAVSHVVNAVHDESGRSGAQILAEGVETREQLEVARTLGAALAQGWLFGRPSPLPGHVVPSTVDLSRVEPRIVEALTPFQVLAPYEQVNPASSEMLGVMSGHIENQAMHTTDSALLIVNVADVDNLDDEARLRYGYITNKGIDVYVLGEHMPPSLGGRIHGVSLAGDDPLVHERTTLFIGSHYASGLFAREHQPPSGEGDGFDAGVSYDRERVLQAAVPLVRRLRA